MDTTWSRTGDIITIDAQVERSGDVLWMLLRSDAHHDSRQCDRALERKHLELAKERGALILDFGDVFDGMQTRTDPRRRTRDLKAEHLEKSYLNAIVNGAAADYAKFAPQWVMIGEGNHEQAIQKYSDYCVTSGLISLLNTPENGGNVLAGGYEGYVRVRFKWPAANTRARSESFLIYYTHGSGGGARRSKGVLKADIRAAVRPDADIVVSAHIHSSWQLPMVKERVSQVGNVRQELAWHLQLPSYKRPGSWEESKEMSAHPLGAHWLRVEIWGDKHDGTKRFTLEPRWGIE